MREADTTRRARPCEIANDAVVIAGAPKYKEGPQEAEMAGEVKSPAGKRFPVASRYTSTTATDSDTTEPLRIQAAPLPPPSSPVEEPARRKSDSSRGSGDSNEEPFAETGPGKIAAVHARESAGAVAHDNLNETRKPEYHLSRGASKISVAMPRESWVAIEKVGGEATTAPEETNVIVTFGHIPARKTAAEDTEEIERRLSQLATKSLGCGYRATNPLTFVCGPTVVTMLLPLLVVSK